MRVLDLFCGAGLVADGLKAAGCEVVGVDIEPQPRYEGPFICMDALALDQRFIRSFDAVWASPPCLRDTVLSASAQREQRAHGNEAIVHPDLITPTRTILRASGLPYIIENVVGAALMSPVRLCGSMFGLGADAGGVRYQLRRHRLFETNWPLAQPACAHEGPVIGVYGGHVRNRAARAGGRGTADFVGIQKKPLMLGAMGLADRGLTTDEISQGVPPAYAEHIARELRRYLAEQRRAA